MATTLSTHITTAKRLLHDAGGNYWSTSELIDYINDARARVVADTGCLRALQRLSLVAGQETYQFSDLPNPGAIDVLNVTVLWGSMRVPLGYMSFTEMNAKLRTCQGLRSRPAVFSVYGQSTIYVAPIPDQAYVAEFDTVIAPDLLVSPSDAETIGAPYTSPIPFYAAYLAKSKEQSYDEATRYYEEYQSKVFSALRSSMTRRLPSAY